MYMKKVIKIILYTLLVLILIILIGVPTYISYWRNSNTKNTFVKFEEPKDINYSNIIWVNDTIGGEIIQKTAFYVPVKIEGIKEALYMQFYSGNAATVLYGKTLKRLLKKYPSVKTSFSKDNVAYLNNATINIGKLKFKSKEIKILATMVSSEIDSSFIKIGTLGFDTFVGRTLILNFKTNKIAITTKSIAELDGKFEIIENASVNKFPLLIPVKIGENNTRLFYDTGSSMFSLLTSETKLAILKSDKKTDTLCCISSWGKDYKIYRKQINQSIAIGTSIHKGEYIYGFIKLKRVNYLPNWFLFGMTGNRLFENQIIAIDNKNNKFGIHKSQFLNNLYQKRV